MVLLDTGTSGTSREIYSEDADNDGTRGVARSWNSRGCEFEFHHHQHSKTYISNLSALFSNLVQQWPFIQGHYHQQNSVALKQIH